MNYENFKNIGMLFANDAATAGGLYDGKTKADVARALAGQKTEAQRRDEERKRQKKEKQKK